jgi:hypothetical protein
MRQLPGLYSGIKVLSWSPARWEGGAQLDQNARIATLEVAFCEVTDESSVTCGTGNDILAAIFVLAIDCRDALSDA